MICCTLPFTPLTAQKFKTLKKWKKHLEISSFYISVPKIMIRWCTVPEVWCMRCNCYFPFWAIFCCFTSLTVWKIKNLKKWKNTSRYHHFTYVYQKIMIRWYTVPEIWCVRDVIVISHFGLFFYPPKSQKKMKKWKKCLEISSFYICAPKIMIICYTIPEICCVSDVIIFHFGPFFALLLPYQPEKSKFWKNEKTTWRYHHFA